MAVLTWQPPATLRVTKLACHQGGVVANQQYQFNFTFAQSLTVTFSQSDGAWQNYQEPNYSNGVARSGGPGPNGGGSYLVVQAGDNVYINLVGPSGWISATDPIPTLNVIVSAANSPGNNQGYTPFASNASANGVFYSLNNGSLQTSDNQTVQYLLGTIQSTANPGRGKWNRYELTVAFAVTNNGTTYYFSDDPEMDVQGS